MFRPGAPTAGTLPLDESPALRYGLAACWLNRADALMRLGGGAQVAEAVRSCDQAIVLLRTLPLTEDPGYPRRLALAHHNRGLFLQAHGGRHPGEVLSAFEEALAVLDHPDAARIDDRQVPAGRDLDEPGERRFVARHSRFRRARAGSRPTGNRARGGHGS